MNKKRLLGIILVLTFLAIGIILLLTKSVKYNKLVISKEKWENIISNRNMNSKIKFQSIKFNDYELLIDEENSIIYYSMVNSSDMYNPSIQYNLINKKIKIAINNNINNEVFEQTDIIKILLYNKNSYRIYSLVVTNYPILNANYLEDEKDNKKIDVELELFDNHVNSPQKLLKSEGKFNVIEENEEYSFSLIKKSVGRNKRENHISIFGMEKRNEYRLKKVNSIKDNERYVHLFINNKHIGLYSLGFMEGGINNFERNKENNK